MNLSQSLLLELVTVSCLVSSKKYNE